MPLLTELPTELPAAPKYDGEFSESNSPNFRILLSHASKMPL
jgi:hypothetical protein